LPQPKKNRNDRTTDKTIEGVSEMELTVHPAFPALLPVVVGLVALIRYGFDELQSGGWKRVVPLLTWVVSVAVCVLVMEREDWRVIALNSVLLTLSANGLWSGGKAAMGK